MTTINYPLEFAFDAASNGKMKISATTNELLGIISCIPPACTLAPCTAIDVRGAAILDPTLDVFATIGGMSQ